MNIMFITLPYVIEPLGIAYLSSVLKEHKHKVCIHIIKDNSFNEIMKVNIKLLKENIDVIAYSVTTGTQEFYININKDFKDFLWNRGIDITSIFGGPHCTYFPEIKKEEGVDIVFRGEAEKSIIRVLNDVEMYIDTIVEPEEVDVNTLPFPDRQVLYDANGLENPIKNIMTSRGCPFACTYCYNNVYKKEFGNTKLRYRDISNVIQEALHIKHYYPKTKLIFFEDDEFVCNKKRFFEFAKRWATEVKIPYHCQIRIERLDEDIIKAMTISGCVSVTYAIETGNENYRKKKLKRNITNKQIIEGAKLLHKYDIKIRTENMIGLPFENFNMILETIDLNIECNPTIGWASIYQPYNLTELGEITKKYKLFNGDLNTIPKSFFEKSVLNFDDLYKKRLKVIQRLFSLIVKYPILRFILKAYKFMPDKLINKIHNRVKFNLYNKLYSV